MGLGLAAAATMLLLTLPGARYASGQLRDNLVHYLAARHGLTVRPGDLILPPPPPDASPMAPREAYFLGHPRESSRRDVYFTHFVLSKKQIPVHASPLFSLSRTEAADERSLCHDGHRFLAFASEVNGKAQVVTILDLAGLSSQAMEGFTPGQRLRQRLTNWQDTGLLRGVDRIQVTLPRPRRVDLRWDQGTLRITPRGGLWVGVVDPLAARTLRGPVITRRLRVGKRSFLTWTVDTVRNLSFVGPGRIQWLEELVYGVVDKARRMSGSEVTAAEIKDEMDLPLVAHQGEASIPGWPPPRLRPVLRKKKRLPGEGRWVEVSGPFVRSVPGTPPLFAMTFVRPDPERLFARVYFVAWDPRRVDLRMRGGTREPRSATGNRGDGMIPRRPALVTRLVAAFNGGFQSIHGDFGMEVAGQVVVPAKPWAATVARLTDGSTGMGTWDGTLPYGVVPGWIHSFRQNLTPLVEGGKFNPWKRGSWGGGAGFITGSGPTSHILRSGLCLHNSGYMMFVLGQPVDGPTLGKTMTRVGCTYGMELDINRGHAGFEFYNVLAPGERAPANASKFRKIKYFSASGAYPGLPTYRYYMRQMIRGSGNPNHRWIGREARDFFYLVTRRMLPGQDLRPLGEAPHEGRWTRAKLPAGALSFPQAMARTFLNPDPRRPATRVHVVALDLRWLGATLCVPEGERGCLGPLLKGAKSSHEPPALAVLPLGEFTARRALMVGKQVAAGHPGAGKQLTLAPARSDGPAMPLVRARPDPTPGVINIEAVVSEPLAPPELPPVRASLCPGPEGVLLYAVGLKVTREHLAAALRRAGCQGDPIFLGHTDPLVLRGKGATPRSVFGEALPPAAMGPSLVLRRSRAPWGTRIFTSVTPQPRRVWTRVQPERTRASSLRHANRAIKALGLAPIKHLRDLCKDPYKSEKSLRKLRWHDPITGKGICGKHRRRRR